MNKINWNPPVIMLRQFCLLLVIFSLLLAGGQYYKYENLAVSLWIVGVATVISLIGYRFPPFARIVFVTLMVITWPIGWIVSHLLLGAIFYLVLTPVAIMMKLCGYDPMKRTLDKSATSYWQRRTPTTSTKRYFQQY
ncbi:MAG: SxtJ family membrane protein [Planctomycetaceae bacterium]